MGEDGGHRVAERFDFAMDRHTAVVTCKRVIAGEPVLFVCRDEEDGDWMFLCGGDHDDESLAANKDGLALVGVEWTVARDLTLNEVAKLCCGESAKRTHVGAEWTIDDGMERFRARVEEHGWMVMAVNDDPPFSYTVGLWANLQHPELIMFGLGAKSAHNVLNACGEHIKAHGVLPLDTPIDGIIDGYPLRIHHVLERQSLIDHIGYALAYYKQLVPLGQVLWPSRDGVFPDEPEAPDDFKALQPLLP